MIVTTLSGVILMKAFGTKACPGPCASTRATGSRYAATSMPPPANADTRRNDRRSSVNAGFFVIVILEVQGLEPAGLKSTTRPTRQHCKIRPSPRYMMIRLALVVITLAAFALPLPLNAQ